jgi:hypothetical protein
MNHLYHITNCLSVRHFQVHSRQGLEELSWFCRFQGGQGVEWRWIRLDESQVVKGALLGLQYGDRNIRSQLNGRWPYLKYYWLYALCLPKREN